MVDMPPDRIHTFQTGANAAANPPLNTLRNLIDEKSAKEIDHQL